MAAELAPIQSGLLVDSRAGNRQPEHGFISLSVGLHGPLYDRPGKTIDFSDGEQARFYPAQTESGNYRGTIIGETSQHLLQQINPMSAVAHPKYLFSDLPSLGQAVRVAYSNNQVAVSPFQPRAKTRELAR